MKHLQFGYVYRDQLYLGTLPSKVSFRFFSFFFFSRIHMHQMPTLHTQRLSQLNQKALVQFMTEPSIFNSISSMV